MDFRQALRRFDLDGYLRRFSPKVYGDERAINCPICFEDGKKLKLYVNLVKQVGLCHYCGSGYNLLDLVMLLEDTTDLKKAVEVVLANTKALVPGKSLLKTVSRLVEEAREELKEEDDALPVFELPEHFVSYEDKWPKVPRYFKERGIGRIRADRYKLGWCDKGYYFNRLVVPIYMGGKLRGFHPRYMKKEPPPGVKKVIYPVGMKSNLCLFNYDVAKHEKRIVIVEDPFSAMAIGRSATAPFGTHLSTQQLRLLHESRARRVTVMFDLDALTKAHELATRLQREGFESDVATLTDARDPDELSKDERAAVLASTTTGSLSAVLAQRMA